MTRTVANIVGNDEFTLEASDGLASVDQTIQYTVNDQPPILGFDPTLTSSLVSNIDYAIPENTGKSYYTRLETAGNPYDQSIDVPGLVHFAAPGMLFEAFDPDGDPVIAQVYTANYPKDGAFQWYPDGSFNYTPKLGFVGVDSFAFTISDGYLSPPDIYGHVGNPSTNTNLAKVTIHVMQASPNDEFANAPSSRQPQLLPLDVRSRNL